MDATSLVIGGIALAIVVVAAVVARATTGRSSGDALPQSWSTAGPDTTTSRDDPPAPTPLDRVGQRAWSEVIAARAEPLVLVDAEGTVVAATDRARADFGPVLGSSYHDLALADVVPLTGRSPHAVAEPIGSALAGDRVDGVVARCRVGGDDDRLVVCWATPIASADPGRRLVLARVELA